MSFTSPRTIPGRFTGTPSRSGRDGIHIQESGLAARTSRSESASESVGGEVLGGAGGIGDSIGIIVTQLMATTGTTPGAIRFTTVAITIEAEVSVALLPSCVAEGLAAALLFTTARAEPPGRSKEIAGLLVDTLNPAVRAASARVPSAATTRVDRKGAFRHAEARASVEAEGSMGAEAEGLTGAGAGIGSRQFRYVSGRS